VSSAARRKGTAFESLTKNAANGFFRGRHGLRAYRPAPNGFADEGDIHGVSPCIWQNKAYADVVTALREGLNGAVEQVKRAGEMYGVAIIKRARRPVGEAYAVMRFEDHCRMLVRLRRAEALLQAADPDRYAAHMARTAEDAAEEFPRA
jgi:hypothetical protein